ncbi:hypothetical protein ESB00_09085 [Oleiharenicola lentus]|uniref:Uncharacterized protein n=1 Tax=Oleiharenicola lentus TaxID=2508720 RepID=A0A4Q1CAF6_9BACT|nr:hypothetical protein [Oleiharenicola lentus]RXK56014.1 hypothetical protein ESB00_09085 [Oleiharenicola lentus]
MAGWLTDFFLFWWALLYWNVRKTWFRLRGAHRDSCPCQHYSDSGHALDSRCSAITHWRRPERFRRACPLLTQTKDGWRCGVDAERVRPFWGRAALYGAAAGAVLYAAGTVVVFAFLRSASYEVSYVSVAWPPAWPELRASQEKLYATQAQQAIAAGRYPEALLALQRVCELNPRNYAAGLTLAGLSQMAGQPYVAEHIYERLMRDVPEQRPATAQIWVRTLLARGQYAQIKPLAAAMLTEDAGRREAWLHCLLFAVRQTQDEAALANLIQEHTSLPDWCLEIVQTEILFLQGREDQAIARLTRFSRRPGSPYVPLYQVERLLQLERPEQALELINAQGNLLPADEASILRLQILHTKRWTSLIAAEYDTLLSYPITPRLVAQLSASFIRHPEPAGLARFVDRFLRDGPALTNESLPLYHAVYLAAVAGRDSNRAERLAEQVSRFTGSDAKALRAVGGLLHQPNSLPQVGQLLTLVPVPLEILYVMLERADMPATK